MTFQSRLKRAQKKHRQLNASGAFLLMIIQQRMVSACRNQ